MRRGLLHEVEVFWTIWSSCPATNYQFQLDRHTSSASIFPPKQYQDQSIDKHLENTETFQRTLDNCSLSPGKFHEHFFISMVAIVLAIPFTNFYSGKKILIWPPKIDHLTSQPKYIHTNTCSKNTNTWMISPLSRSIYTNNKPPDKQM